MDLKVFQMLDLINARLGNIEKNIARIDEKLEFSIALQRNHLIRVKNGEDIDDNMILFGKPYNDLSPAKAYEIYQNQDMDFIIVDVSGPDYKIPKRLDGSINIPFSSLEKRAGEIPSRITPILVISEDGLNSILACELLIKKGFFNINNISGGHQFWPGHQTSEMPKNILSRTA
ncbi:MAG: rhodanese-like domain-containing protein [Bdellovibrio sp.]|nr:rhodanese-like domain-containing protein [Bdellovibrio sp.]